MIVSVARQIECKAEQHGEKPGHPGTVLQDLVIHSNYFGPKLETNVKLLEGVRQGMM